MYFRFKVFFDPFYFFCHIVYPFSFFVTFSWLHILVKNLLLAVSRISFRCFEMSCLVCIVLLFVDISLIFILSPVLSCLYPQVLLLLFLALLFRFCLYKFQHLSFVVTFGPVFGDFLSAFPVEFPIRILIFPSYFLRWYLFSGVFKYSSISRSENQFFFYHCPYLVGKVSACLKTSAFFPDFSHSFLLSSFCRDAP